VGNLSTLHRGSSSFFRVRTNLLEKFFGKFLGVLRTVTVLSIVLEILMPHGDLTVRRNNFNPTVFVPGGLGSVVLELDLEVRCD